MSRSYPEHVTAGIQRGRILEYWTIAWLITVVPLMALVMGSSQAMKTVWIEDMLGFIPPLVYLLSVHLEKKKPTAAFPYGFDRVNSAAFLVSAAALTLMGTYLLFEAVMTLIAAEHPTVPTVRLFGREIWMGWLMVPVLLWSSIPSMILGRLKLGAAQTINDSVLHTDAEMQKADWMTGFAALLGIMGIGLGFWWADAVAAGLISFSVLHDGINALRGSTAELVDGTPRKLEGKGVDEEARAVKKALEKRYPNAAVRLRETGRVMKAEVASERPVKPVSLDEIWPGSPDRAWRLDQISFVPRTGGKRQQS